MNEPKALVVAEDAAAKEPKEPKERGFAVVDVVLDEEEVGLLANIPKAL